MAVTVVPNAADLITAVVDMLRATCRIPVGDGEAPVPVGDGEQVELDYPYLIVYPVGGGGSFGDVSNLDAGVEVVVQVSGVGRRRDQAQHAVERARQSILGRSSSGWANSLTVPSGTVLSRTFDSDGGVTPEGTVFTAVLRFRFSMSV